MEAGHLTALLPDIFRHKSNKVRVFKPQVILLDFHGTISERRWEDKVVFPYVKQALQGYLRDNWTSSEPIQRALAGLRNESFEQRFRHKYEDAPLIDDHLVEQEQEGGAQSALLAQQVADFLLWQMNTRRETRETQLIEQLVWQDGLRRQKIRTPLYEDVWSCVRTWREQHHCALYVISSTDANTLKLLFENTNKGNLAALLSGYVDLKRPGDKLLSDTYKSFYEKLSPASNTSVLYLTDSGQEAKAASRASSSFECLLVNRPGNKRIRTYYLSQFQYVASFADIEFIEPNNEIK